MKKEPELFINGQKVDETTDESAQGMKNAAFAQEILRTHLLESYKNRPEFAEPLQELIDWLSTGTKLSIFTGTVAMLYLTIPAFRQTLAAAVFLLQGESVDIQEEGGKITRVEPREQHPQVIGKLGNA